MADMAVSRRALAAGVSTSLDTNGEGLDSVESGTLQHRSCERVETLGKGLSIGTNHCGVQR